MALKDLFRAPRDGPARDPSTASPAASPAANVAAQELRAEAANKPPIQKIVVAIHGIGNQLRSQTIRSVAQRFGDRVEPPLPVMPLGFFSLGNEASVRVSRLDVDSDSELATIGFAEVFWADIPEQVVKANDKLEETKAWGRTVVSRAEAQYRMNVPNGTLTPEDFQLGVGVVEEVVETVDVLEKLLYVSAAAGLFKFELKALLRSYVGDVQLVTDFPYYRLKIVYRFHKAMLEILQAHRGLWPGVDPEIYIVAHSEGSVISFLGLLQALSGTEIRDPDADSQQAPAVDNTWLQHVRGFMTIGSPIDKHLVLWPGLWQGLDLDSHMDASQGGVVMNSRPGKAVLPRPIRWRNYYDMGDPIGFQLDTAADFLKWCKAFEFDVHEHNIGFSRYWLPGRAHNDYWNDSEVFGHFIDDVVAPVAGREAKKPKSSWLVDKVSLAVPYAVVFALHVFAVFVFYKAVTGEATVRLPLHVGLLSLLLTCVTVAARLPSLVKTDGWRWHLAAALVFMLGAVPCIWLLPAPVSDFLGGPLAFWSGADHQSSGKWALMLFALVLATSGWWIRRRPAYGRRGLIAIGTMVILFVVLRGLAWSDGNVKLWPVLLAAGVFLYTWWIAILLFDLTFVWHRYIRRGVFIQTLTQWKVAKRDAIPRTMMGLGAPSEPRVGAAAPPHSPA